MAREKVERSAVEFERATLAAVERVVDRSLPMRAPGSREARARAFVILTHEDWLTLCGAALKGLKKPD